MRTANVGPHTAETVKLHRASLRFIVTASGTVVRTIPGITVPRADGGVHGAGRRRSVGKAPTSLQRSTSLPMHLAARGRDAEGRSADAGARTGRKGGFFRRKSERKSKKKGGVDPVALALGGGGSAGPDSGRASTRTRPRAPWARANSVVPLDPPTALDYGHSSAPPPDATPSPGWTPRSSKEDLLPAKRKTGRQCVAFSSPARPAAAARPHAAPGEPAAAALPLPLPGAGRLPPIRGSYSASAL